MPEINEKYNELLNSILKTITNKKEEESYIEKLIDLLKKIKEITNKEDQEKITNAIHSIKKINKKDENTSIQDHIDNEEIAILHSLTRLYFIPKEERTKDNKIFSMYRLATFYLTKNESRKKGEAHAKIGDILFNSKERLTTRDNYKVFSEFMYSLISSLSLLIKNTIESSSGNPYIATEEDYWQDFHTCISIHQKKISEIENKEKINEEEFFLISQKSYNNAFRLIKDIISNDLGNDTSKYEKFNSILLLKIKKAIKEVNYDELKETLDKIKEIKDEEDQFEIFDHILATINANEQTKDISNSPPDNKIKITLHKMFSLTLKYSLSEKDLAKNKLVIDLLDLTEKLINKATPISVAQTDTLFKIILTMISFKDTLDNQEHYSAFFNLIYQSTKNYLELFEEKTEKLDSKNRDFFEKEIWENADKKILQMINKIIDLNSKDNSKNKDFYTLLALTCQRHFKQIKDETNEKFNILFKTQKEYLLSKESKKIEKNSEKKEERLIQIIPSSRFFAATSDSSAKITKTTKGKTKKTGEDAKKQPTSTISTTSTTSTTSTHLLLNCTINHEPHTLTLHLIRFKYGDQPTYAFFSPSMDENLVKTALLKMTENNQDHVVAKIEKSEKKLQGYDFKVRITSGDYQQQRILAKILDLNKFNIKELNWPTSFNVLYFSGIAYKNGNKIKNVINFNEEIMPHVTDEDKNHRSVTLKK